jgi:hypothetical protein
MNRAPNKGVVSFAGAHLGRRRCAAPAAHARRSMSVFTNFRVAERLELAVGPLCQPIKNRASWSH